MLMSSRWLYVQKQDDSDSRYFCIIFQDFATLFRYLRCFCDIYLRYSCDIAIFRQFRCLRYLRYYFNIVTYFFLLFQLASDLHLHLFVCDFAFIYSWHDYLLLYHPNFDRTIGQAWLLPSPSSSLSRKLIALIELNNPKIQLPISAYYSQLRYICDISQSPRSISILGPRTRTCTTNLSSSLILCLTFSSPAYSSSSCVIHFRIQHLRHFDICDISIFSHLYRAALQYLLFTHNLRIIVVF